jgi:signal transduction histidine kinase
MRGRFFMRMAVGFAAMFLFSVLTCTVGLYLIAGALQQVALPVGGALVGLFVLAALVALAGARAVRRATSPIDDLLEASGRIAEGDYSVRVRESGPREVRALANAFNAMATRLQAHDENRRGLLADVTHELRTPLTVMQGNLEGLLDGVYPRDDAHVEMILEETRVLSRLIDDLRTLSLAESGALQLHKEPTDLATLMQEAAAAFRAQADAAGVDLIAESADGLPPLEVDPARMREVLANLMTNALRYTPRGGRVRVACARHGAHRVELTVSDTGPGVAPEDLPRIFDRFYKSRDSQGSGLGLAIVKNLVEAHGGEVQAESGVGQGMAVRVSLPV